MAFFISSANRRSYQRQHWRDRARTPVANGLTCLLVFSVTGLLTHGLAWLALGGDAWLMLLSLAVVAGAPVLAAGVALHIGDGHSPSGRIRKP